MWNKFAFVFAFLYFATSMTFIPKKTHKHSVEFLPCGSRFIHYLVVILPKQLITYSKLWVKSTPMKMAEQPKENPLHISWHDSVWIPHLSATNIMDYFGERTNPFYSRECNNEFIKMQQNTRVDQLTHMTGVEYMLLHTQVFWLQINCNVMLVCFSS